MATTVTEEGESGALFGAPPPRFTGDRKQAANFLLAFKGWRAANNKKKAMVNPYTRVVVALTFIKGEDIQDWKEHKLNLLEERVLNGHAKTEEYLWREFEKAFKTAFKDTNRMLNAQTKLDTLQQDKEGVKQYTVTFNRLLKQAGFNEDDKGSVGLYRKGLLSGLHKACIRHKPMPTTMKEWQEVAAKEQLIFREIQHMQTQWGLRQHLVPKPKAQTPPTQFWKAPGPNVMNVDLATTEDKPPMCICYNCQKPRHIKANCCNPRAPRTSTTENQRFNNCKTCGYCSKPGHDATQCYALKRLPSTQSWNAQTQVQATETNSDAGTEKILLTKDNFKDMLLTIPKEERATVVEEMLSQDFSGETN
jgi:hypothetical protein